MLNHKNAPKKIREKVIRADKLIDYIKKEDIVSIGFGSSEAEMRGFAKNFLKMYRKRDIDYTQKYLNKTTENETPPKLRNISYIYHSVFQRDNK